MFKHPRPILIVDDDVELVTLLVDYLQLEGFAPVAAHNGTEALELLTGIPAGRPLKNGGFTHGSLYDRVDRRLEEFGRLAEHAYSKPLRRKR